MTPSPWQLSHLPPLTLNENQPGRNPRLRVRHHREELADECEQTRVGGGLSRRPADGRLVDLDDLVEGSMP